MRRRSGARLLLVVAVAILLGAPLAAAAVRLAIPSPRAAREALRRRYPAHAWALEPEGTQEPGRLGFAAPARGADLEDVFAHNLAPDLAPWRARGRAGTLAALITWLRGLPPSSNKRVVALHGGRVHLPFQDARLEAHRASGCRGPCHAHLHSALAALDSYAAQFRLPDAVFLLAVSDHPVCRKPGDCPGPSLSYIKGWDAEVRNEDILVPFLHEINQTLRTFPWTRKIDRAFFRGSAYCQAYTPKNIKGVCSRSHFAQLSRLANNTLIEAGLVEGNVGQRIPPSGPVPLSELPRFKFLLHLEGVTASSRLSKLLAINSVVLKQAGRWVEWYYRSLVDGVHYLGIWTESANDVLDVLARHGGDDRLLRNISEAGQRFAARVTSRAGRMLYWRRLLDEYAALYPGMAAAAADLAARSPPAGAPL